MKKTLRLIMGLLLALTLFTAHYGTAWGLCIDKDTLTVTNAAAVGISSAKYLSGGLYAQGAIITFEGGNVRAWFDGSSPTTTVGHLYYAGSTLNLGKSDDIINLRMIAVGGNVQVTISLWR